MYYKKQNYLIIQLNKIYYFGKKLGLNEKQNAGVFKRMFANKPLAIQWIENSFLSEEFKEMYVELMDNKYSKVGLTFKNKKRPKIALQSFLFLVAGTGVEPVTSGL